MVEKKSKVINNYDNSKIVIPSKEEIALDVKLNISFKHNMDSLKSLVDLIFPYLERKPEDEFEAIFDLIEETSTGSESEKKSNLKNILKNVKLTAQRCEHPDLFYKSNFIVMLSYFEFLLKDVIKCFYLTYPKFLERTDKNLTYKDFLGFDSLDDVLIFIIDKECTNMTYGSFKDYIKEAVEKRLKIKNFDCPNLESINEAFLRRNILVHNNGIVNDIYIKKVDPKYSSLKKGENAIIERDYFKRIFKEIELLGNILQILLIEKLPKKDKMVIQSLVVEYPYELLLEKSYNILITYFHQVKKIKFPTESKICLIVNYLIAEKNVGKKNLDLLIEELIPDWSIYSPMIKAAVYALRNNKDDLKNEILNTSVTIEEWNEYPLFEEQRKDELFSLEILSLLESKYQKKKIKNIEESKKSNIVEENNENKVKTSAEKAS